MHSFLQEIKFEVINIGEDNIEYEKENILKMLN